MTKTHNDPALFSIRARILFATAFLGALILVFGAGRRRRNSPAR